MAQSHENPPASFAPDFNALLRANLEQVFNERDADKRIAAVQQLFSAEPTMYEPEGIVTGQAAISDVAGALLEQFGPDFSFVAQGVAVGHHGMAYLRWQAGPKEGPVVVTGADVAEVVDGKIVRLWVLLDSPAQ
jgi:predicted PhzF superfamily epimerase YddE/YHI9